MPIIGGLLTGNPSAYSYLPETALSFPFGQEFCQELRGVGFINPVYRALTFGIAYLYTCEKPARTR
ncbi:MAG: hypothetical protein DCC75_05200 [Proteobacteria bacterium]|nr:MAG: hypothetical protein DCC75_05200 [Pseudomonadota bacterium]